MRHPVLLLVFASLAACVGDMPPPPQLTVTSPHRGLVQNGSQVTVTGTALPNVDGDPVTEVTVNGTPAQLAADGSFTATVTMPAGAMFLETVAKCAYGGQATDARAVQVGDLRPVGTSIERAVTASLSADAFTKLANAAGPLILGLDLDAMLAPMQPMAAYGDDNAHVALSISQLSLGGVKITLVPIDGGLTFSAEIDGLSVSARADYDGTFVPDGHTTVKVTTDTLTLGGTLAVTPVGISGFTTAIRSPLVTTAKIKLDAGGLVGSVLGLVQDNLQSTLQTVTTRGLEQAMGPMINQAFGALAGPQHINVLDNQLTITASPAAVAFSPAGAQITMDLQAMIDGAATSPGYIFTPNGTPTIDPGAAGIQLGLADDLINELLSEITAMGMLQYHHSEDFGLFDQIDIVPAIAPMISANNADGSLRILLGDMVTTVSAKGKPIITAALNAQADLEILRGANPQDISLQFGEIKFWINVDGSSTSDGGELDISSAARAGLELQIASLKDFLVTVPTPSVAGISLDSLEAHADSGYVMISGQLH